MNIGAVAIIIAIVAYIKTRFPQVNGIITIAIAVALGGVAGYFGIDGLNVVSGIIAGAEAVGVHTTATVVGGGK
jgi:hypothetical protein